ncbi:MAG: hypothetical protein A2831_03440 [Candidatus Yanofskybacteria bacterium RIFCSPHIGHO2_01_FULL_44_17]|uniref:Uncharacterized protein n=1 Tax=Candidatus Yanofskybacteria bacterium RIFCSPHIGHO2_01_FULL_44_17 TaxID=1802668 RepID=A0A1F8EXG7_9BACT|nr:MAG: hypothetical protein A2831_03440 [Candidatus Yanofskybacteria bacterium RIFCSPHIGHO2_01_FULL_44_17]
MVWFLENWYFFYIPVHFVIGALSWAWFNYSVYKALEEEYGIVSNMEMNSFICKCNLFIGLIGGPISLFTTLIASVTPYRTYRIRLRYGLKFL